MPYHAGLDRSRSRFGVNGRCVDNVHKKDQRVVVRHCVSYLAAWLHNARVARSLVRQKVMDHLDSPQTRPLIRVTDVGFFDYFHRQRGVAPTGIELHPVLDVEFP